MLLYKLFQGVHVGKMTLTNSFKIHIKFSVLLHKTDAVHVIGTDTRKIIICFPACMVFKISGNLSFVIRTANGALEFTPSFCAARLFPCPQLNKLKYRKNVPAIFKSFMLLIDGCYANRGFGCHFFKHITLRTNIKKVRYITKGTRHLFQQTERGGNIYSVHLAFPSLLYGPPYHSALPCKTVPLPVSRNPFRIPRNVVDQQDHAYFRIRLICHVRIHKLWSFLYPLRKFAGDVPISFLKNFPKDDWSAKPNFSAISFMVRSVKISRRLASVNSISVI